MSGCSYPSLTNGTSVYYCRQECPWQIFRCCGNEDIVGYIKNSYGSIFALCQEDTDKILGYDSPQVKEAFENMMKSPGVFYSHEEMKEAYEAQQRERKLAFIEKCDVEGYDFNEMTGKLTKRI